MLNYIRVFDGGALVEVTKSNGEKITLTDVRRLDGYEPFIRIFQDNVVWVMPRSKYSIKVL